MSKSPTRRFENCYMPPKKFHWRFDNPNPSEFNVVSVREAQSSSPVKKESGNMGLLVENKMKSNSSADDSSPAQMPVSPAKKPLNQDAPLDFSVRNHIRGSNNESPMSPDKILPGELNYPSPTNCSDYLKKFRSMVFPGMANGGNSPPPPMGSGNLGNWFSVSSASNNRDKQSRNENRSSPNMDCSKNLDESPIPDNGKIELNRETKPFMASPEYQSSSRENSPVTGKSILQGMLKTQDPVSVNKISSKIQNISISNAGSPPLEGISDLGNASHVMTAANQHMLPPLMTPMNNLMQLPLGSYPFLGGMSYMGTPVSALTGGLLSQPSDATVLQALAQRRARRKKSEDRPFKCYPMEVLEEKLQSVSANAYAFGLEYTKQLIPSPLRTSPPSDQDRNVSMIESAAEVNSAINSIPCAGNGTENPASSNASGDSNDSLPSMKPETAEATSCTSARKRKSTADVEKDDAYWDRRRKNNLAAKRSREARRRKEDAIANMAVLYENQNLELKQHAVHLGDKLNETTTNLYRLMREHENLRIQNNILQERLSQKRCGHCGAQLPTVN